MDYQPTNRERKQEPKRHSVVMGAPVPKGIHVPTRKELERRRAVAMRKAMKG